MLNISIRNTFLFLGYIFCLQAPETLVKILSTIFFFFFFRLCRFDVLAQAMFAHKMNASISSSVSDSFYWFMLNTFQVHQQLTWCNNIADALRIERVAEIDVEVVKINCNQPWYFVQIAIDLFKWTIFWLLLFLALKRIGHQYGESEDLSRLYKRWFCHSLTLVVFIFTLFSNEGHKKYAIFF